MLRKPIIRKSNTNKPQKFTCWLLQLQQFEQIWHVEKEWPTLQIGLPDKTQLSTKLEGLERLLPTAILRLEQTATLPNEPTFEPKLIKLGVEQKTSYRQQDHTNLH